MQTVGAVLLAVNDAAQYACGSLPRTAVARMGCCTSLLYELTDGSKITVKESLTSILRL
jgi:hypothetical protein